MKVNGIKSSKAYFALARNLLLVSLKTEDPRIAKWDHGVINMRAQSNTIFSSGYLNVSIQRHAGLIRVLPTLRSSYITPNIWGASSTILCISSMVTLRHWAWFWERTKSRSEPGLVNQRRLWDGESSLFGSEGRLVINWWKWLSYTL